jgi:hypothetical protein
MVWLQGSLPVDPGLAWIIAYIKPILFTLFKTTSSEKPMVCLVAGISTCGSGAGLDHILAYLKPRLFTFFKTAGSEKP